LTKIDTRAGVKGSRDPLGLVAKQCLLRAERDAVLAYGDANGDRERRYGFSHELAVASRLQPTTEVPAHAFDSPVLPREFQRIEAGRVHARGYVFEMFLVAVMVDVCRTGALGELRRAEPGAGGDPHPRIGWSGSGTVSLRLRDRLSQATALSRFRR
jgi:hypothetical protein